MARTNLYPPSVDPGFPRLPTTPVGWRREKFADIVEVVERPINLAPNTKYRLVTAKRSRGGIASRGELLGREILTKTQFEARAGDFLISRRQIIHGACGIVPAELDGSVVSNEYSTLRARPGLLMEFMRHYSHTAYFQRTCFHSSHGVDVEKMIFKIGEWLTRDVDVPSLAEQGKIAAILSSVNDVIEKTEVVIKQLKVVTNAMIRELLTRGLPGRHARYKLTAIGEIPDEWQVERLETLATVERGKFSHRPRNDPRFFGGSVPFIQTGDVAGSGGRIENYTQTLNDEGVKVSRVFPTGTIVITIAANIGDTAITMFPVAFPDSLVGIRANERIDHEFLELVLRTRKEALEQTAPQNAQKNINLETLKPLLIQVPLPDEQQEIARVIAILGKRARAETTVLDDYRSLKSALMSTLLTGELRVTPGKDHA
jgi:type I restriction enzyme S subunit